VGQTEKGNEVRICPSCGQLIRNRQRLTRQEWRVFTLLGKRRSYGKRKLKVMRKLKVVGDKMDLTERTIKAHSQSLYRKLQIDETRDRRILAGIYFNCELLREGLRALDMLPLNSGG
jgi:hypothetical protein